MTTATIAIEVNAEVARAFAEASAEKRRKLQLLLSLRLRELTAAPARPLKEIMDDIGAHAEAPGQHALLPAGTIPSLTLPPERRLSWLVEVLPHMEQAELYDSIDRQISWGAAANLPAVETPIAQLRCPDWVREFPSQNAFHTPYVGIAGLGADAPLLPASDRRAGVFGFDRRIRLRDISDGTANTMMILETARDNGPWAQGGPATVRGLDPAESPYLGSGRSFGGTHFEENFLWWKGKSIGCNAAMADASVRFFLRDKIAPHVLEALFTIAGGESLGLE
jgi:hypothetical protein